MNEFEECTPNNKERKQYCTDVIQGMDMNDLSNLSCPNP